MGFFWPHSELSFLKQEEKIEFVKIATSVFQSSVFKVLLSLIAFLCDIKCWIFLFFYSV